MTLLVMNPKFYLAWLLFLLFTATFAIAETTLPSFGGNEPVPTKTRHPWYDYTEGKINEARLGYARMLEEAERAKTPNYLWNAYMENSWFYHQIAEIRDAITYANKALEVAKKNKNKFQIGRSTSWLGWSYAEIGLYDLALEFYKNAIEIGAPEGKVELVAVWGMSTQEMGYILFRRGDLEQAKKIITETTNYAREHGISVGVAEGAAHLAEIALTQGKLKEAKTYAEEAVKAALDCNCSPLNTARAMLALAKTKVSIARDNEALVEEAKTSIKEALNHSEKAEVKRFIAEANILLSKLLPVTDFGARLALVGSAYEILEKFENEQRGLAGTELGIVYLENNRVKLASFYLEQGLSVNEGLFRTVDEAHARGEIAELKGLKGEIKAKLTTLTEAFKQAENTGALILALVQSEKLSEEYFALGYLSLSITWSEKALYYANQLLDNENEVKTKESLYARKLEIVERLVEANLKLKPEGPGDKPT